ncbi:MAG: MFS transporter, partial [Verrucomicrobia bacterium]|nr:MFS transporter [Verrucomicrobiota bacterium]
FQWRAAYLLGGVLGLTLLALRFGALESGLFERLRTDASAVERGNFLRLFADRRRLWRYLCCILAGLPLWYMVGILMTLAPELAGKLGVTGEVTAGRAITFCYLGIAAGDFASGVLTQLLHTRKRVILAFQLSMVACVAAYFSARGVSVATFYSICAALGFAGGYWAVLLLMSAEQFGTNLRATAATTVPNFIRGALTPLTLLFGALKPHLGLTASAAATGAVCLALALLGLSQLAETSGRALDFLEE